MAKKLRPTRVSDLSYHVTFFDKNWNVIDELTMTVTTPVTIPHIMQRWRELVFENWVESTEGLCGLRRCVAIGMEVVYV